MTDPIRIDIWSDIACPWCYLGKHRLETALAEFEKRPDAPKVEISYHSYQLSPDLPEDYAGSHADYLKAKTGMGPEQLEMANRQLAQLGTPYGIAYNFKTNRIANTHKALELLHFAKAAGKEAELKEALFKAHFSDGVHVGQIEALADIAAGIGLDRTEAVRVLTEGLYVDAVEADKSQAAQLGITGVPFFVVDGKYGLSGAQGPGTFLRALDQVDAERKQS